MPASDQWAIRDSTLRVRRGEFVAVVGPSGSGKTTLLSLVGLLDRPTSGAYALAGREVSSLSEAERDHERGHRFGFVFQNSYVLPDQSVGDNVALGLKVRGIDRRTRAMRVMVALETVGLGDMIDRMAGSLSGGEKQRVSLARALAIRPDAVLADEPTGALDTESSRRLVSHLRGINSAGVTVVVVTHDPVVAAAADRRVMMVDGLLIGSEEVRAGVVPSNRTAQIGQAHSVDAESRRKKAGDEASDGVLSRRLGLELKDAVMAPLARPGRWLLVVLAYLLGVAALVGAVGLTSSTTGQIVASLTAAGSTEIRVFSSRVDSAVFTDPYSSSAPAQALADLEGIEATAPVITYSPSSTRITRLGSSQEQSFTGRIIVSDSRYLTIQGLAPDQGRIDLMNTQEGGSVVVLGAQAAERLGVSSSDVGVDIVINGRRVPVVAVLTSLGDVLLDDAVYASFPTTTYLTGRVDCFILVKTQPGYAEPLEAAIPLALSPENPGSVTVTVVAQLAQLQQAVTHDLTQLLWAIGAVILCLSALTAGVSMFLTVTHRAPQIALRRALGASQVSIWRMYTVEGLWTGLVGASLGVGVGVVLTWALARAYALPLHLGWPVVLIGLAVGAATGIVASAYPAWHAAHRDPASILREA
ncbi:MAG: ATP-binding cassette domain-containing protein [Propionibacteriaceae bacterium]|nr:ATP-binding cassette domain-containing protein [Propionibacteriaceae bacterium]